MIDTLYDNFSDHTLKSIEQLGMNPKDVKYVIVTHGHNDHVGGAKTVQSVTGARLVMAEGDWVMSKLPRDIVVKDGDTIKKGCRSAFFSERRGGSSRRTTPSAPFKGGCAKFS